MVEPCTCGEAMGAQAEMKANVQMAMLVPSDIFSSTDGKLLLLSRNIFACVQPAHKNMKFFTVKPFLEHVVPLLKQLPPR